jgi:hypothetical protein
VRYSTLLSYVFVLFLLILAQSPKAQTQQLDESIITAARELANTNSKMISILAKRFFLSFFPQPPDKVAPLVQALAGRFEEIYADVATPIFARRMTVQEMRLLTEEFKAPVSQALIAALAESVAIWMSCMRSELGALPRPEEPASQEQNRLAQQLWMLQNETNSVPPTTSGEPAHPPSAKIRQEMERFQEEWRKRSNCIDDGATAVLAKRLTVEELKALIALEQSQPVQKLNSVMEEVNQQLGLKMVEEIPKIFGAR